MSFSIKLRCFDHNIVLTPVEGDSPRPDVGFKPTTVLLDVYEKGEEGAEMTLLSASEVPLGSLYTAVRAMVDNNPALVPPK